MTEVILCSLSLSLSLSFFLFLYLSIYHNLLPPLMNLKVSIFLFLCKRKLALGMLHPYKIVVSCILIDSSLFFLQFHFK